MIYSEEEFRKLVGEEDLKKILEIKRLRQNNDKRLSEIAQKYKNFTMSEERINQILNAKNEDNLEVTREEAEYLGLQIVDESYFK
ncbi:MAG: hypothetical protein UHG91_05245 [Succinivibrionaceae bacterium]|nr:hypothetical protein [Succinivibrionaceae bacterium]